MATSTINTLLLVFGLPSYFFVLLYLFKFDPPGKKTDSAKSVPVGSAVKYQRPLSLRRFRWRKMHFSDVVPTLVAILSLLVAREALSTSRDANRITLAGQRPAIGIYGGTSTMLESTPCNYGGESVNYWEPQVANRAEYFLITWARIDLTITNTSARPATINSISISGPQNVVWNPEWQQIRFWLGAKRLILPATIQPGETWSITLGSLSSDAKGRENLSTLPDVLNVYLSQTNMRLGESRMTYTFHVEGVDSVPYDTDARFYRPSSRDITSFGYMTKTLDQCIPEQFR